MVKGTRRGVVNLKSQLAFLKLFVLLTKLRQILKWINNQLFILNVLLMMPICWRDYKSWCNHICSTPCQHNHHHYVKDSKLSERVQHRFTRLVSKLKKLSCGKRLEYRYLGLWILVERRNRAAYGGPGDIDKKINISYERNTNSFVLTWLAGSLQYYKMYKVFWTTPINDFFVLQTATRTGHAAKLVKTDAV